MPRVATFCVLFGAVGQAAFGRAAASQTPPPGAAATTATPSASDARACVANFSEEGSFLSGKTFKTFQEFPKLDKEKAFVRMAQTVASDGWQGVNANKEIGVITAVQTVAHGKGKQAPLNVVMKPLDKEAFRIEAVFTTTGGLKVSTKDMQTAFCRILESAEK